MRRSISALAVGMMLLVGGVLVAGCGGGGSTTNGEVAATAGAGAGENEAPPGPKGSAGAGGSEGGEASPKGGESRGGGPEAGESSGGEPSETESGGGSPGGSGSSGEGQSSGEEQASGPKAAFVAKANALCAKQTKKIQAGLRGIFESAQAKSSKPTPQAQLAIVQRMVKVVAPGMEAEADRLRSLEAPPGDKAKIAALADAIDGGAAKAREEPQVILANTNVFAQAQSAARQYGINACAQPS